MSILVNNRLIYNSIYYTKGDEVPSSQSVAEDNRISTFYNFRDGVTVRTKPVKTGRQEDFF